MLVTLVICFLAAELALRIFYRHDFTNYYEFHESRGHMLRSDFEGVINHGIILKTNSDGLRDKEYGSKQADQIRIIALGDSVTMGTGVRQADIFTEKLEELLNKNSEEIEGQAKEYQVVNFGVTGYNLSQEVAMLKDLGPKYQPDIVLLTYVLNDVYDKPVFFLDSWILNNLPTKAIKALKNWHNNSYFL